MATKGSKRAGGGGGTPATPRRKPAADAFSGKPAGSGTTSQGKAIYPAAGAQSSGRPGTAALPSQVYPPPVTGGGRGAAKKTGRRKG